MFEKALEAKFKKIFGLKKVTFDQPGDSQEQECLFIEVDSCKNSIKDGRAIAQVRGNAVVFANNEKMPFGYFSKCIQSADAADTKDLFFFDFEGNTKGFRNIVQRGFSFVYFFNSQYDPATGSITSITAQEVES